MATAELSPPDRGRWRRQALLALVGGKRASTSCVRACGPPLTDVAPSVMLDEQPLANCSQEDAMNVRFLGKDPDSQIDNSPTLYATDREDRVTYIAQGWKVTDPEALAAIGPVPDYETLIEIPEDVLKFYARRYTEEEGLS